MAGMSFSSVLRAIIHILGSIRVPGSRFWIATPVAMTTMPEKMHRDEANRHGKPYPIVLQPVHAMSPLSDRFADAIATPETWY
ncbi:MAG: hypothetical protein ABI705_12355 [Aestuariivirga sp.]